MTPVQTCAHCCAPPNENMFLRTCTEVTSSTDWSALNVLDRKVHSMTFQVLLKGLLFPNVVYELFPQMDLWDKSNIYLVCQVIKQQVIPLFLSLNDHFIITFMTLCLYVYICASVCGLPVGIETFFSVLLAWFSDEVTFVIIKSYWLLYAQIAWKDFRLEVGRMD